MLSDSMQPLPNWKGLREGVTNEADDHDCPGPKEALTVPNKREETASCFT